MAKVRIDLRNYRNKFGDRIKPGRYLVAVDYTEVGKAKSGNEKITLLYRVIGGEFDGSTIADNLMTAGNALFRTVGFLQAIGVATPRRELIIDPASWEGKRLEIDVNDGEPYSGNVRSEVRGYLKLQQTTKPSEDLFSPPGVPAETGVPIPSSGMTDAYAAGLTDDEAMQAVRDLPSGIDVPDVDLAGLDNL